MNLFRLYHIKIFLNTVSQPRIEEIYYNFQKIEISIYINMTSFGSIFIAEKMLKVSRQHLHKKWAKGSIYFFELEEKIIISTLYRRPRSAYFLIFEHTRSFLCTKIFLESSKKVFDSYSNPSLGGRKWVLTTPFGSSVVGCYIW